MEVDDDQSKHRQVFNFNVPFTQEPAEKSLVIIIVPFAQEPAEKSLVIILPFAQESAEKSLKCVDKSHTIDKSS